MRFFFCLFILPFPNNIHNPPNQANHLKLKEYVYIGENHLFNKAKIKEINAVGRKNI